MILWLFESIDSVQLEIQVAVPLDEELVAIQEKNHWQVVMDPRRENRFSENRLSEISDAYFRLEIGKN